MKRIALIDHVGSKAGMDYYSGQLAQNIALHGVKCLLISNFKTSFPGLVSYAYFDEHSNSKARKILNHFIAFFRAAIRCRINHCSNAIVHIFSYELKDVYALLVLRLFCLRVTAIVHDVDSFSASSQPFSHFMLHTLCSKLMVHNNFSLEQLREKYGTSLSSKTAVIPHGNFNSLPDEIIEKAEARNILNLGKNKIYLLFFGQIKAVKGLDILLEAMTLIPDSIHLIIAGKTWQHDFEPYKKTITQSLQNRVTTIIRFIPDDERNLLFKAADMIVLPYKRIFQSGVLLMAMSYKLPVIASNLPPNAALVQEGKTGGLFENENARDLAKKIIQATADLTTTQKLADAAYHYSSIHHDWKAIAQSLLNHIQSP